MSWTLITGSAQRLGAQLCYALAEKGYDIVVHYNKSEKEALQVVQDCRKLGVQSECIQGDFSTLDSTQDFVDRYLVRFSDTSNLIHNVGNYLVEPLLETSISDWYALFQTNLHAPWLLTRALASSLKRNKGNVIHIGTSGLHSTHANVSSMAYHLSKLSLWGLTLGMARELASDLVRVNMVSPGILDISVVQPVSPEESIPLKRMGKMEEVARVVAFLLDPKSAYITGQNIEVAGGVGL